VGGGGGGVSATGGQFINQCRVKQPLILLLYCKALNSFILFVANGTVLHHSLFNNKQVAYIDAF
jgi:hypothetical protein